MKTPTIRQKNKANKIVSCCTRYPNNNLLAMCPRASVEVVKPNQLHSLLKKEISSLNASSFMLMLVALLISWFSFHSNDQLGSYYAGDSLSKGNKKVSNSLDVCDLDDESTTLLTLSIAHDKEKATPLGVFAQSGHELVALLKEKNLWDVNGKDEIPELLITGFPADLSQVRDVQTKKRAFIHALLPVVMVAMDEVRQERERLLVIIKRFKIDPSSIVFSVSLPGWQEHLSDDDVQFVLDLSHKYRTNKGTELLNRVNVLPASLVIAQGAVESSWGGSRFSREANNIFGMWTWQGKGLIPAKREQGKTHKIAIYDSILDSVRAYILTLNRVQAYDDLRRIRATTFDPYQISEGLLKYSEKGELYVSIINSIIETNQLQDYDKFRLAAG